MFLCGGGRPEPGRTVAAGRNLDGRWQGRARRRRDIVIIVAYEITTYVMKAMAGAVRRFCMAPMAVTTATRMRPLLLLAVLGGAIMAGTLGLWAYYGTAVFFEIVRAGWAACF